MRAAPPSPRMSPRRFFENGRHVSGETTRMASQAFRNPRLKIASLPPVTAISDAPLRTIQNAWPSAWFDDEQAVEMVHVGPVMPYSSEMRLAPALAMIRGMVNGFTRPELFLYRPTKPSS